ncbi:MAG: 16S rRNA processing protein RimM [Oscillospiraceae bacterium]|nr:16S rRNA processing protein RimM [Oscillospiraceae bacterium]
MKKQFLEIGKIVNTHGLGGVVKVMPWCDSAEFLCEFETLYRGREHLPMEIERASVQKNMALIKFAGVDTPEAANALRNTILYMNRADVELDDDTYFIQDLQGMRVVDADDGREYGKLHDVLQTGANDVYEVEAPNGRMLLVPVIPDVVLDVNFESDTITIRPLKGLFDDAD